MWKTYVLVFKFIRGLKSKRSSVHMAPPTVPLEIKSGKTFAAKVKFHRSKIAPISLAAKRDPGFSGIVSPFVNQSVTRQLAFGFKDPKESQTITPTRTFRAEFYNGKWGPFVAKIITVTVLLVVLLFIVIVLVKK